MIITTQNARLRSTDVNDFRLRLADHAAEIATALLGDPNPLMSTRDTLRFGRKGSLAIEIHGSKAGLWHDFEQSEGGDLLALIQRELQTDFRGSVEFACSYVGDLPVESQAVRRQPKHERQDQEESTWKKKSALSAWNEAIDVGGTLASAYIAGRGIVLPEGVAGNALRFHPRCAPYGHDPQPSMLGLLRKIESDEPCAIQRTALSPTGSKIERRTFGPKSGAAVKLSADADVTTGLTIGEGVETTLSGMMLGYQPAWSVGDAGELARFPVLAGIECLTILVDHDERDRHGRQAGISAAAHCADRWTDSDRSVTCVVPNVRGCDLNDVTKGGNNDQQQ
jgi:hypothetical protein